MAALLAWSLWGSVTLKWMAALALAMGALLHPRTDRVRRPWTQSGGARWALVLLVWMLISMAWSAASVTAALREWAHYLPLLLPALLADRLSPQWASRLRAHFVVSAALVGLATAVAGPLTALLGAQPGGTMLLSSTVMSEGNQRIATSLLLALGSVWALQIAATSSGTRRVAWALAGLGSAWGLLNQDRRSGMVALAVLLVIWAISEGSLPRRLMKFSGLLLLFGSIWVSSSQVQGRFQEGWHELENADSPRAVDTSWGQRAALTEGSLHMAQARPLAGWGLGSWEVWWRGQAPPNSPLARLRTAHNEYLQVLTQQGLVGLTLLLAWGVAMARATTTACAVPQARAALVLLAVGALFNAVLRDSVFGLPLLIVLGVSLSQPPAKAAQ
ncbi:O-antigen ligase family protein [Inhella gelatinilytica]|uniref:O-antigen ligase family protein n=1 Tax=Inhella gelatinilytica TaxID=2795030 RepID=A0A931IV24_9BURK|nr:O-antigen ligase family protein [Inhella gelatinilytica]MBH9553312.1 O-antigen ligase family protein [Inhella gelatinilytica]